ncbi:enolase C-terminal domain-like protein [Rathayibacter toxicus]|uniref:enolase C-terminal domain-like protein n=1 Tax=Rathayibacter toxicus TaxID=145458 RepID=UPI000CE75EEB|nr:enolase C-terminal domain-like protein [Rathayibacter toxicus]PPI55358.1 hypothetical protein C5D35_06595 [Rathayibacter toxicus]QOD11310.1 hypothetical protein BSG36_05065 [Rathayibacter toxicus]QWL28052.1 hypothetical protein E2R33_05070 [Rathayibacter toxicus]QWL32251.1 hypothetical protein E2R35_04935 [Rathayibacter toxicus]QWL34344.1 hypothetical protein E2R36_04935 [Rathayibacter toxicus]
MTANARTEVRVDTSVHVLAEPFRIAGQVHDDVLTLTVSLYRGGMIGRGECNPYSVRGHDLGSTQAAIAAALPILKAGLTRPAIHEAMPPGPARNAVDCALLDLECKERRASVGAILGIDESESLDTAQTIGLLMEGETSGLENYKNFPIIKLKIDRTTPFLAVARLRQVAPRAVLIVDANGSLDLAALEAWLPILELTRTQVLEQPVAPGEEMLIEQVDRGSVLLCADESFVRLEDLAEVSKHYDMINVKLDKIGGITAGLEAIRLAHDKSLQVLVGCMIGTSLSAAPAWWLANEADLVDIDGPTWLSSDIDNSMTWTNGRVTRPRTELWGYDR